MDKIKGTKADLDAKIETAIAMPMRVVKAKLVDIKYTEAQKSRLEMIRLEKVSLLRLYSTYNYYEGFLYCNSGFQFFYRHQVKRGHNH